MELTFFRFANIFDVNSGSDDNIQNAVKTVKSETFLDLSCDYYNINLNDDGPLSQVMAVEQKLQIKSSEQINESLTNKKLETAGEMFLYLIMCPYSIKPWLVFYKDLFQTQSPDQIILTLNRLMKATKTPQTDHFAKIAETLYKSIKVKSFPAAKNTSTQVQVGKSEGEYLIINHPVHIMTRDNQMSPSAFIPFCDFGGNMSAMGVKIDQFVVPVCNSFQAKIMNDQLCYEVDLNKFSDKNNIRNELKLGLNFLMDYNEDRQVTFEQNISRKELGLANNLVASDQHASVYLDSIGRNYKDFQNKK